MFVRVINCSNESKVLKADRALGVADPVCGPFSQQLEPETERGPGSGTRTDDAHIQCLIDGLPPSLTEEQRMMAAKFLREKASIFSKSATDLGRNRMIPHRIDTGDHPPVRQSLRRQPYAQLEEIEKNVQELLQAGVIRPSTSAWSSNVLLVKKKDGSSRFCVDMRKVNDVTVKQAYPLPHIDTCLESLGGANFFSTLDLRSGYFQVELHPDDAEKTAFVTRSGHYEFTVLSMGLANAPSQFQRLMDLVLSGLVWESCLVYLDDVIIFSKTFEQHLDRLDAVFSRLASANLLLKASKCQLFCESVKFLGHIVSRQGIAADPAKLATVRNWPQPTCLTELMSFIGLCSYYRKFVEGFATIAKPLHVLTGKGQPFFWGPDQEAAFQTLKVRLTAAPILASPENEGEYVLDTDASLTGLGGVLQQRQGGEIRVIAYASRCLTRAERNYSTTRRELLAVIYALKQFRTFLLGRHFLLRVDHSALTYLRKTPEVMGQAARWLDYIEQYQFTIEHRNGKAHGNCDGLSRRPCSEEEKKEPGHPCCRRARNITTTKEPEDSPSPAVAEGALDLTPVAVGLAQKEDPEIWPIWKAAQLADQPPTWKEIQSTTETTRALWGQFKSLKVIDDVLYREYYDSKGVVAHLQLVLPRSHRLFFLQSIHELYGNIGTAHLGVKKTQQHVSQRAYWPTWKTDVERYCRRCIVCQSVQHGVAPRHGLMQLYEPNGMGDRLHVDLTGPHIPSRQGATYILTAIDAFTRFLVAVPLRDKRAITVAEALVDRVILPFGCWRTLVSDQGSEWCNELLVEVTKVLGIQKLRTTAYRASANGRIERVHRTINDLLSKVVSENQRDWQDFLPKIVTAYNAASHETTGMSPFYLTYGRPYCTPLDLVINAPEVKPSNVWDYVNELENNLRRAYSFVNEHLHTETQRMKKRYDARVQPLIFQSGDLAFYYCPRRRAGRNHKWARLCQVCRIERPLNDVLYLVRVKPKGKALVVHVDRLKAFSGETPSCWEAAKGRADVGGQNPNTVVQLHGESVDFRQTRQAERLPSSPRETTTNTRPRNTSPSAADNEAAVQTGRYFLRQPEQCRRPMRLWAARIITARLPEIATSAPETGRRDEVNTERSGPMNSRARNPNRNSCINRNMEDQTSSPSATEPKRRRKRNRGPWNCELCQRPPFGSISGFRNHVILNHGKDCSWTGVIRAPQSAEQLSQLVERAKRSRGHRERDRERPRISVDGSDDASAAGIDTARAVPRVCRIRLASPPLEATTSDTGSLTDVCVVSEARIKSAEASSRATQTEHVARVSTESQTPLMGAMYLPDGLSLDMVLDVVHAHPGLSSSALVDLIGRSRTAGLPSEQYLILELIIRGMTMAANRLAAVVATQVIRAAQLPAGEEGERHRAAVQEFVNGLVNRPPRDPPTRPPPLDLTAIPAEIDVLEAIERRFVFQRRLIGRRPPSPPISYLIDGSGYSTIDISDTEYEVGTNVTSTSSENGLD
jgi:transposase InsO family protein